MSNMKNLDYAVLLEVYESMLTDRQCELMKFYYWEDMSLGEIAECLGITRQAVRDGIKRSEQTLTHLEGKLRLAEKIVKCQKIFNDIENCALKRNSEENLKNIYSLASEGRELFS